MIFFVIILLLACFLLGLIILIQNPKGGGLAGNVAGFSNQFMGVKQTNNVLEKGTWILAIVVALLCIFSVVVVPKAGQSRARDLRAAPTSTGVPTNSVPQTPSK
jgi:preprotein translocase subunit SecG